ncbi:MAG: protein kinase domain-containing protein [Cumulibacter sp.]
MTDTEDEQPGAAPSRSVSAADSARTDRSGDQSSPPAPDQRLLANRYRLDSLLGRGSMGAVWKALDVVLGRSVAVKEVLLPPTQSDEENDVARERALREARSIAALSHPNVVTLYDVVEDDGRPWVVMELVPAKNLAEIIKDDGTLQPAEAARIGLAVLAALISAHEVGITHRDVKPGNILVSPDGRVKLADFGISRRAEDSALTRTGLMVGSPSYIAPEVARGRAATSAADMWGLGATLQCAVEGTPPFDLGDPVATLTAVVGDAARPAPHAGPLQPIITAMLQKDPRERMRPDEAKRALQEVVDSRPAPRPTYAPPSGPLASTTMAAPQQRARVNHPAPAPPPGAHRNDPRSNPALATRRVDPRQLTAQAPWAGSYPPGGQTSFRPNQPAPGPRPTQPGPPSRPVSPMPASGPIRNGAPYAPNSGAHRTPSLSPSRRAWDNPWIAGLIGLLIAVLIGTIAIIWISNENSSSGNPPTSEIVDSPQPSSVKVGGGSIEGDPGKDLASSIDVAIAQ